MAQYLAVYNFFLFPMSFSPGATDVYISFKVYSTTKYHSNSKAEQPNHLTSPSASASASSYRETPLHQQICNYSAPPPSLSCASHARCASACSTQRPSSQPAPPPPQFATRCTSLRPSTPTPTTSSDTKFDLLRLAPSPCSAMDCLQVWRAMPP
jgi:hypothetical protein